MSGTNTNSRKADYLNFRVKSVPDARWSMPDAGDAAMQYKPDPEKLDESSRENLAKLTEMGYGNKVSMRTTPNGSELQMSLEVEAIKRDGGTYKNFPVLEQRGQRKSIMEFVEKFDEDIKNGKNPLVHASGKRVNGQDGRMGKFYIHFSKTEAEREEYKKNNPRAAQNSSPKPNTNNNTKANNNTNQSLDDEIPF